MHRHFVKNAWMLKSCANDFLTTQNVASKYHRLAWLRRSSWWSVATMMWRRSLTVTSTLTKSSRG